MDLIATCKLMTLKSADWNYPHRFQAHISNDPNNSTSPTHWHFKSMHTRPKATCNRKIRVILQNISEIISLLCLKALVTFSLVQSTGKSSSRSLKTLYDLAAPGHTPPCLFKILLLTQFTSVTLASLLSLTILSKLPGLGMTLQISSLCLEYYFSRNPHSCTITSSGFCSKITVEAFLTAY